MADTGMANGQIRRIQDQLRRALEGPAWHGPSLRETVADMTPEEAARRPFPGAHTAWEILQHVAVWLEIVARRSNGEAIEPTPAEDWATAADPDERALAALRERIDGAHRELQRTLDDLTDDDLARTVPGKEYDTYLLLHGAVQHTLYHAGQVALLKKAARAEPSPPRAS